MATLKSNGNEVYKVVSPGTSGLSVNDTVNSTGVTVNSPFSDLKLNRQGDASSFTGLKLTADTAGSTVTLGKTGSPSWTGSYSIDSGSTWTSYVPGTTGAITLANVGDSVCFKGTLSAAQSYNNYLQFSMTGSIAASGNIMSICSGDNFASVTTIPYNYCFESMFKGCTSLTIPPTLPATTLAEGCYRIMFYGCTSLTTAPTLPATTLASNCYYGMFWSCTSFTTAPTLPATTLEGASYCYMFSGCTSLTTAPVLSATTLVSSCYNSMFKGCTSLTTAPTLPATTLVEGCYQGMFEGCTSLTSAPALNATTMASNCYRGMFVGCTSLTTAPELPATTLGTYCYAFMFYCCTSLTTAPQLLATTLASKCYWNMFNGCTSLYVSDTSGSGYNKAWRIPTTGTFTNTKIQEEMFTDCLGTRSSNNMAGAAGQSYTYYTQNTPVS